MYAGLPTDLATAQIVCEHTRAKDGLPCETRIARLTLFTAGGSPCLLLEKGASTGSVSPDDHVKSAVSSSVTLCGQTLALQKSIMAELQKLNKDLLRSLQDDRGRVDARLVCAAEPWETKLLPLSWEAVQRLWLKVSADPKTLTESGLQSQVLRLVDRGYLTWDLCSREVYPPSVSTLFFDLAARTSTSSLAQPAERFAEAALAIAKATGSAPAAISALARKEPVPQTCSCLHPSPHPMIVAG